MRLKLNSRWQAPATVIIGGSIIALAVGIGHGWSKALIAEAIVLALGVGYFLLTGSNSDVGAIYGGRADERQHQVYLRASAAALRIMLGTAFICAVITVALNDSYWQSDVIGSVGGLAFLICLVAFGDDETRSRGSAEIMSGETIGKVHDSIGKMD